MTCTQPEAVDADPVLIEVVVGWACSGAIATADPTKISSSRMAVINPLLLSKLR
jgi:hypothetical protein